MSKGFLSEINTGHRVVSVNANVSIDWALASLWNRAGIIQTKKQDERNGFSSDPKTSRAVEQVVLPAVGPFKSVMQHGAVLEEEIEKKALEQFYLGRIQDSHARGVNLIYTLMILNGKMPMKMEDFDLNDILRGIVPFISPIMRDDITIQVDIAEDSLPMKGDMRFIKQAVGELILNGRDALPFGGTIALVTRKVKVRMNSPDSTQHKIVECALLSVVDTGKGIDPQLKSHIFEPFFTTKPTGTGHGLGLTLVNQIVQAHKGCFKIISRKEEGTSARMFLPLLESTIDIRGHARLKKTAVMQSNYIKEVYNV